MLCGFKKEIRRASLLLFLNLVGIVTYAGEYYKIGPWLLRVCLPGFDFIR